MEELLHQAPAVLLASCRIAGVAAVSPVFNNRFLAPQVRVILTFLLAFLIYPLARPDPALVSTAPGLLIACATEVAAGLVLGFLNLLVFATVQMTGAVLDLDMGFTFAQVADPVTGIGTPIVANFFQNLALTIYLAANGHHWLLRALAQSYEALPAGALIDLDVVPMHVVRIFGVMLVAAVKMVLPFLAVILITTVALAGVNRAMPQLHLLAMGLGLKAVIGLAMLVVLLPYMLGALDALFAGGHEALLQTMDLMKSP